MENLDFWNIERDERERIPLEIVDNKDFQVKFIVDLLNNADTIISNESIETHQEPFPYQEDSRILKTFNLVYNYKKSMIPIDIIVVTDNSRNDFNLKFSTIEKDIDFSWIEKNPALEKKVLNSLL